MTDFIDFDQVDLETLFSDRAVRQLLLIAEKKPLWTIQEMVDNLPEIPGYQALTYKQARAILNRLLLSTQSHRLLRVSRMQELSKAADPKELLKDDPAEIVLYYKYMGEYKKDGVGQEAPLVSRALPNVQPVNSGNISQMQVVSPPPPAEVSPIIPSNIPTTEVTPITTVTQSIPTVQSSPVQIRQPNEAKNANIGNIQNQAVPIPPAVEVPPVLPLSQSSVAEAPIIPVKQSIPVDQAPPVQRVVQSPPAVIQQPHEPVKADVSPITQEKSTNNISSENKNFKIARISPLYVLAFFLIAGVVYLLNSGLIFKNKNSSLNDVSLPVNIKSSSTSKNVAKDKGSLPVKSNLIAPQAVMGTQSAAVKADNPVPSVEITPTMVSPVPENASSSGEVK